MLLRQPSWVVPTGFFHISAWFCLMVLTTSVLVGATNPLAHGSAGGVSVARHWERPPAGWNAWFAFDKSVTQEGIMRNAEALVRTGLRDAGCALGPPCTHLPGC